MYLSGNLLMYLCYYKALSVTEHSGPEGRYWYNKSVLHRINLGTFTLSLCPIKEYKANKVTTGWQYTCSTFTLHVSCMPDQFPCISCTVCSSASNANDRSFNDFSILIWQLVHETTLINEIYQPFRSFLLDEGSVILIAKECIDIKTRTPTLEI